MKHRLATASRAASMAILVAFSMGAISYIVRTYPAATAVVVIASAGVAMVAVATTTDLFARTKPERAAVRRRYFWVPLATFLITALPLRSLLPGIGVGVAVIAGVSALVGLALGVGTEP